MMKIKTLFMLTLVIVSANCHADYSSPTDTDISFTVDADDHAPKVTFTPETPLTPSKASASKGILGKLSITYDVDVTNTYTCLASAVAQGGTGYIPISDASSTVKAYGDFYNTTNTVFVLIPSQIQGYFRTHCKTAEPSVTYDFRNANGTALSPGVYSSAITVVNYTP